jgi:hypothetical protein
MGDAKSSLKIHYVEEAEKKVWRCESVFAEYKIVYLHVLLPWMSIRIPFQGDP